MRTRDDLEAYLLRSHMPHHEAAENLWIVRDPASRFDVVVKLEGDYVIFRVKVIDLARVAEPARLFEELLRLNATDMIHGAYGIVDGSVVLTCTLRLENLDYNELQGTLDDFSLALTKHYARLGEAHAA
ncbi:MAG: hypothetical protein U0230_19765 [Polyangiales bacterium]